MALSLGVQKGQRIRIDGKHTLLVEQVIAPEKVRIRFMDKQILVTDLERSELMPNVYVSCGRSSSQPTGVKSLYSRLAFEAPRSIVIERL